MSDVVRARIEVGDVVIEKTVGRAYADAAGLSVLDEPTHNPDGAPRPTVRTSARSGRPAKQKTTASTEAAKKKAVTQSADEKEESK